MSLDFDFVQIPENPENIQDGGGGRPSPGHGMVVITKFEEYGSCNGKAHLLEYEVVAWTNQADVAKTHFENFFHADSTGKGWPQRRMTCLAMAAGLFNANDVRKWKESGSRPSINMQALVGRPIMIVLEEVKDQNNSTKTYINIGNIGLGMFHIKDPKVATWPKNQAIFNRAAAAVGEWIVAKKDDKPSQKPAAASAATSAASSADPFGGTV